MKRYYTLKMVEHTKKGAVMKKTSKFEILAIRLKTEDKIALIELTERKRISMSTWARQILMREVEKERADNVG